MNKIFSVVLLASLLPIMSSEDQIAPARHRERSKSFGSFFSRIIRRSDGVKKVKNMSTPLKGSGGYEVSPRTRIRVLEERVERFQPQLQAVERLFTSLPTCPAGIQGMKTPQDATYYEYLVRVARAYLLCPEAQKKEHRAQVVAVKAALETVHEYTRWNTHLSIASCTALGKRRQTVFGTLLSDPEQVTKFQALVNEKVRQLREKAAQEESIHQKHIARGARADRRALKRLGTGALAQVHSTQV